MRDFTEIERRMRALITTLQGVLPEKVINEVRHFIEHGEYGVALEELKYVYDEKSMAPKAAILTEIIELSKLMEMDIK